jgi:hypothetical protein
VSADEILSEIVSVGVEVARIEAEQHLIRHRIAQVELGRPDRVTLRAQAEEFALDRVQIEAGIELLGQDRVE